MCDNRRWTSSASLHLNIHQNIMMSRSCLAFGILLTLFGNIIVLTAQAADFDTNVGSTPPFTDYCEMLSHDIQGKEHAFLSGNNAYYMSEGRWFESSDETIGLTHPFFNDLRSRGTGIATHNFTGTGNDFWGWDFHKYVKVAFGTVIGGDHIGSTGDGTVMVQNTMENGTEVCMTVNEGQNYGLPVTMESCNTEDVRQQWNYNITTGLFRNNDRGYCLFAGRPDLVGQELKHWGCDESNPQMIWDYDEPTGRIKSRSGYNEQYNDGKCVAMTTNTIDGSIGAITSLCDHTVTTQQWDVSGANLEVRYETPSPDKMYWRPDKMIMEYAVENANIREEKFISNDVISTIITSDIPITMEFKGKSFAWNPDRTISKNATVAFDSMNNAIHVVEGGKVLSKVQETPPVIKEAKLMYNGMHTVLSASRPLQSYKQEMIDNGEYSYTFRLNVDSNGTTLSWTMHDDYDAALHAVQGVISQPLTHMVNKTVSVNELLNYNIPFFRCDDDDIVQIYYYLWSLYLIYFRYVGKGQEVHWHTQTAVNNFLGLHNWDAVFQNYVGSWTADLSKYAYGNILIWSELPLNATKDGMVPDNMGQTWNSGLFGGFHHSSHACGAWQIYQHSGDISFLSKAYTFFFNLFQESGVLGEDFDASICLGNMAASLNRPQAEVDAWGSHMERYGGLDWYLQQRWDDDRSCWLNCEDTPDNVYSWTVFRAVAQTYFPNDWAKAMGESWLSRDNPDGFYSEIPLSSIAMRDWHKLLCPGTMQSNPCGNGYWSEFAVTPDTNYFMHKAMWIHGVTKIALDATLGHLKLNNMQAGIPIAPESREADFSLWGDQHSNFNAGKILSLIEGVGGFSFSINNSTFVHKDSLPTEWSYMEWRIPVRTGPDSTEIHWVLAREDRYCTSSEGEWIKTITVESNPLESLILNPWTEEATLLDSEATATTQDGMVNSVPIENIGSDRLSVSLTGDAAKGKVSISLRLKASATTNITGIVCAPTVSPISAAPTIAPNQQTTSTPTEALSESPSSQPSSISSCTVCDNIATPWMVKNGKECTGDPNRLNRKCNKNRAWISNKYCQLSCYDAGNAYEGDICCSGNDISQE